MGKQINFTSSKALSFSASVALSARFSLWAFPSSLSFSAMAENKDSYVCVSFIIISAKDLREDNNLSNSCEEKNVKKACSWNNFLFKIISFAFINMTWEEQSNNIWKTLTVKTGGSRQHLLSNIIMSYSDQHIIGTFIWTEILQICYDHLEKGQNSHNLKKECFFHTLLLHKHGIVWQLKNCQL